MAAPAPALSVVLPVHEAMPYLTVAVRDVLRQEVEGGLELVCAWDGGAEDSWAFLVEAAGKMQGGSVEVVDAPGEDPQAVARLFHNRKQKKNSSPNAFDSCT